MDANQYYQTLLQQGHSPNEAAHFTSQYYPGFQPPMQGAGMMTPPPGGMTSPGMGAPYGGYSGGSMGAPAGFGYSSMGAGGMAAAGAAGGGAKIAIIAVVSVLALGGLGTAGYFIYDYLTEPDFYGETYWTEEGFGLIFEEDELTYVFTGDDFDSETCEMMEGFLNSSESKYKNGKCYVSLSGSDIYEIDEKGDYYKACISFDDELDEDCIKIYPLDGGAVMKDSDGECDVVVSDIRDPDFYYDGDVTDNWKDDFDDKAEDLRDDGPSNCDYD